MLQRSVAYSPPLRHSEKNSDACRPTDLNAITPLPAQSLCTVNGEVESLPVQLQDQLSSHVQKRCDKAWRNISNLLNPWRWLTSSGLTRPSSSSSPNVLSTCKPSAVFFLRWLAPSPIHYCSIPPKWVVNSMCTRSTLEVNRGSESVESWEVTASCLGSRI